MTTTQRQQIPALLARRAEAFGFLGDVWTTKRVAVIIQATFGVSYHPAHISRLLCLLGLSVQILTVLPTQRDDAAIDTRYDQRWPALKKGRR